MCRIKQTAKSTDKNTCDIVSVLRCLATQLLFFIWVIVLSGLTPVSALTLEGPGHLNIFLSQAIFYGQVPLRLPGICLRCQAT